MSTIAVIAIKADVVADTMTTIEMLVLEVLPPVVAGPVSSNRKVIRYIDETNH